MNNDLFKIVFAPKIDLEVKANPIMHQTKKEKFKWFIEVLKFKYLFLRYKFSVWKNKYLG